MIAAAALMLVDTAPPLIAQDLLFRNARVFDGQRVVAATDVLVRQGRITELGKGLKAPAGVTVIDAAGKTLLPGLIDAHTHVYGDALREAVIFGVTTELDMFTDATVARTFRQQQAAGKANDRADLFSAGILVTAPGGHGTEYGFAIPTITSPDSAQPFVDARIAEGSDYIKIVYDDGSTYALKWATISRATMKAVIEAAHKRGKLAVVHIGNAASARAALESGADGLVHLFTDLAASDDIASLAKSKGAFIIPTMVVLHSITGTSAGKALVEDPQIAPYLSPNTRQLLEAAFPANPAAPKKSYDVARRTVRALHAAGVPILAGTDASNPGTAHGAAMHRELELLVDAGLSPMEALAAGTSVPAKHFKLSDRGRIAVGLRADLVLVNGDPTTDISRTRHIDGVWKGGAAIDRASFAKVAAEARAAYGAAPKGLANGLISNFDDGTLAPEFGTAWMESTDSYAGGKSTARMEIASAGAQGTAKSLRMTGQISDAVPFAWSGSMWSPGLQPFTPADLSSKKEVRFWTRGDGRTYQLFAFAQSKNMQPLSVTFVADAEWKEVVIPWSAFGIDGHDIMALVFAAGPKPGAFAFQIDQVRLQ